MAKCANWSEPLGICEGHDRLHPYRERCARQARFGSGVGSPEMTRLANRALEPSKVPLANWSRSNFFVVNNDCSAGIVAAERASQLCVAWWSGISSSRRRRLLLSQDLVSVDEVSYDLEGFVKLH